MSYAYTTAALIQAELQSSTAFSTGTLPTLAQVTEWIAEESEYINQLSDTIYGSTVYSSEFVDYDGENFIILENSPIISIGSVQYNTNPIGSTLGSSWVAKTEGTDYALYSDRGGIAILYNNFSPETGRKRFCITYTAGYATTPYHIQKLATKIVAERVINTLLQKNVNERNDGGSISVGSINIVEPASYGVNSYKQLKMDIEKLKDELATKQFHVFRYNQLM